MERVITAVTRSQKSQLTGISYKDMLSFLTSFIVECILSVLYCFVTVTT